MRVTLNIYYKTNNNFLFLVFCGVRINIRPRERVNISFQAAGNNSSLATKWALEHFFAKFYA